MSADEKLLRLVQLTRDAYGELYDNEAAIEADALLGELSREYAAQAARIAELTEALRPFVFVEHLGSHEDAPIAVRLADCSAARRALTPGGE